MAPLAIVWGAILSLFGVILALWLTGTSLNIISFLGAIIGVGIVAKNGILMLDYVDHLRMEGLPLVEALVRSGRRRLRPVLMTSLAAALGMLPLAYGKPQVVGVKEGYIDYLTDVEAFQKAVPEAVRTKFAAVVADLKSGTLHLEMPLPQN